MSDQGIKVEITAEAGNLKTEFDGAAKTVETGSKDMASASKEAADASNQHTSAITQLRETLQGLTAPIRGIRANLGELAEAFVAAFAVEKLIEFVKRFEELGAEVSHLSQRLGISAQDISVLSFASGALGIDLNSTALGFSRLQINMEKASQGSPEAAAAFRALGVDVLDAHGKLKTLDEILPEIADRFADTADGPNKLAIATAIGGRGFSQLIPLLDQGSKGLEEMKQIATETGTVLSTSMAEGMEKSAVQGYTLGKAFEGVGITLYEAFKPAIDTLVQSLIGLVEGFNNSIQKGGFLNYVLEALVIAFDVVVEGVDAVVTAFKEFLEYLDFVAQFYNTVISTIGQATKDAFSGHWGDAVRDTKAGLAQVSKEWEDFAKKFAGDEDGFNERLKQTFSNIGNGVGTGDRTPPKKEKPKPDLPGIDTTGAKEAEARIEAETKAALAIVAIDEEKNSTRLKLGQITDDEFAARATELENKKYEIERDGFERRKAIIGLDKAEVAKLNGDELVLEQSHALALLKIQDDAAVKGQALKNEQLKDFISEKDAELKAGLAAIQSLEEQGFITKKTALQREKELTLQIEAEELARVDAQIATLAVGTKAYEAAMKERNKITAQFGLEVRKDDAALLTESQSRWKTLGDSIKSTFNGVVTGLVNGTETFGHAMAKIALSIIDSFVQMGLQIAEDWAKTQLTNLLFTQTTASEQAVSQVAANAAVAGSGAYAATAVIPYIGPALAPGAAATAYAGALSFGSLAFAERGAVLGEDQLVYAHKDEMILPSKISGGIQNLIDNSSSSSVQQSGPAPEAHFHISAIDAQGVAAFFNEHGRTMAATFVRHAQSSPGFKQAMTG